MSDDAAKVVKSFAAKWDAMDTEGVLSHLSEDCVCNNTPYKEVSGKPAIRSYMNNVFGAVDSTRCNWKSIVSDGHGQVLCEVEKVMSEGGRQVSLPTMVTFTVRNGKITRWNSYFDKGKLHGLGKLSEALAIHA